MTRENIYGYVGGNPANYIDPDGLEVRGTYYQAVGILTLVDLDNGDAVTTRAFSGNEGCTNNSSCEGLKDKGPVPRGRYLIGNGYDSRHGGDDRWYRLYGSNGEGGYAYNGIPVVDSATGFVTRRGGINLHTGLFSNGCLTVPSDIPYGMPGYPSSEVYSAIRDLLDRTQPMHYNGSTYRGTIDVR